MIPLDQIQKRLTALACPMCKKSAFTVHPRGDQSFAETSHTVMCAGCRYTFKLSIPTRPISQVDPDTANFLAGLPCPACQETGVRLDFRCMPNVRESVLFVTCTSCDRPFTEKAPMEAYE
jgi:uncharacterized protein YbaR (Trm112 family)